MYDERLLRVIGNHDVVTSLHFHGDVDARANCRSLNVLTAWYFSSSSDVRCSIKIDPSNQGRRDQPNRFGVEETILRA